MRPLAFATPCFAAAVLFLAGCGEDGPTTPRKLVCNRLPIVESKDLVFAKFFYPDSKLEQAADLTRPGSALKKYGWYLDAKISVSNANEKAVLFDTLDSRLTVSAPGDTDARFFAAHSAPITVGPKRDTVITARFTVRMNELGSALSQKFLDGDVVGYEVGHRFAYRLQDTAGCAEVGPSSGADTTRNNTDIEKNIYGSSVAATSWTLANWEEIRDGFVIALEILGAILKAAGHV